MQILRAKSKRFGDYTDFIVCSPGCFNNLRDKLVEEAKDETSWDTYSDFMRHPLKDYHSIDYLSLGAIVKCRSCHENYRVCISFEWINSDD